MQDDKQSICCILRVPNTYQLTFLCSTYSVSLYKVSLLLCGKEQSTVTFSLFTLESFMASRTYLQDTLQILNPLKMAMSVRCLCEMSECDPLHTHTPPWHSAIPYAFILHFGVFFALLSSFWSCISG